MCSGFLRDNDKHFMDMRVKGGPPDVTRHIARVVCSKTPSPDQLTIVVVEALAEKMS